METYFILVSKIIATFIFSKYIFVLKKFTWQTVQCFIACLYGYIINIHIWVSCGVFSCSAQVIFQNILLLEVS